MATIKDVKELLLACESLAEIKERGLLQDDRISVQRLVQSRIRKLETEYVLRDQFERMKHYENVHEGRIVCGVDEAGRGPIAGDVVAAAVILPRDFYLAGLNDSKQLSEKKREAFREIILENAAVGIGMSSPCEIDRLNIYEATKVAMERAIRNLREVPEHLLLDAINLEIDIPQTKIIRGDAHSVSIAAASVIAKTERDRLMMAVHKEYPMYGFNRHKGYGTTEHIEAVKQFGVLPIHRKSFEPIKSIVEKI